MPRLLALYLLCITTLPALANGGMDETPHRSGADVWTSGKRLSLDEEFLTFDLDANNYRVTVDYRLRDANPNQPARMYFPVLCATTDEPESCLPQLLVSVNGNAVTAKPAQTTPALRKATMQLDERLKKQIGTTDRPFEFVEDEHDRSAYLFYQIDLPTGQPLHQLAIQYQAPYLQTESSTSKSPYSHYSPAYANYDFALAAAWAGGKTKALHITVNPPTSVGNLSFDQRDWPFQQTAGPLRLTINQPNFARLPPLTLALDNGDYQNFRHIMSLLGKQQSSKRRVDYRVKVLSAKPAAGHNDPAALTDGNPNTFWCWKGPRATLELTTPIQVSMTYDDNPEESYSMPFMDVSLLNGAAGSERSQYGSARTLSIKAADYVYRDNQPTRFELPQLSATQGPYAGFWSADSMGLWWDGKSPQTIRLRIDIERSWPGGQNDESCLSELFPTYNPG